MNYLLFIEKKSGKKVKHAEGWNDTHTVCGLPCDSMIESDGMELLEVTTSGPITCAKCKEALRYFSRFVVK